MKFPDSREDLESRSPNLGPHTTKGTLSEPLLRDLLFGSSRGSGFRSTSSLLGDLKDFIRFGAENWKVRLGFWRCSSIGKLAKRNKYYTNHSGTASVAIRQ